MISSPTKFSINTMNVALRLRACGITPTQQRVSIGETLFAKSQHVSAEQVLAMVNKDHEQVSKATVYNTLGLFAIKGLLQEVIIEANKVFYDTNLDKHHHLYHVDTGMLEDIDASQVRVDYLPELPKDTILENIDVIIRLRKS
jgi:Fur family iron response transcriptional regulator